jgi:hypothetical protein
MFEIVMLICFAYAGFNFLPSGVPVKRKEQIEDKKSGVNERANGVNKRQIVPRSRLPLAERS